jgi:hypothetical protein
VASAQLEKETATPLSMLIAQTVATDVSSVLTPPVDLALLLKLTEALARWRAGLKLYFLGGGLVVKFQSFSVS